MEIYSYGMEVIPPEQNGNESCLAGLSEVELVK
jgi:hypothetical protein